MPTTMSTAGQPPSATSAPHASRDAGAPAPAAPKTPASVTRAIQTAGRPYLGAELKPLPGPQGPEPGATPSTDQAGDGARGWTDDGATGLVRADKSSRGLPYARRRFPAPVRLAGGPKSVSVRAPQRATREEALADAAKLAKAESEPIA